MYLFLEVPDHMIFDRGKKIVRRQGQFLAWFGVERRHLESDSKFNQEIMKKPSKDEGWSNKSPKI